MSLLASISNALVAWLGLLFGLIGTIAGTLSYLEARRSSNIARRLQANELLDVAFDKLAGQSGSDSFFFDSPQHPEQDIELARREVEKALIVSPDMSRGWLLRGLVSLSKGQLHDAEHNLQNAIRMNAGDARAYNALGIVFCRMKRSDEGFALFEAASQLKPDYSMARHNLGVELEKQGRLAEALSSFELATRLAPSKSGHHHHLARVHLKLGNVEAAVAGFRLAAALAPNAQASWSGLARALTASGRADEAMQARRAAEALQNRPHS